MRNLWQRPALVFVLVVIWKIVLAIATVQPIPANDSFFYDGAVVNYISHGRYVNSSLAEAFPISGGKVFSAYPPLYQGILLPWMLVFGTSARSVVMLHVLLFVVFTSLIYCLLKVLRTPVSGFHIAAAFLFSITFHDRPDTLAHMLGVAALLLTAKACVAQNDSHRVRLLAGSVCAALCMASSVQVGATYGFVVVACMGSCWLLTNRAPALPIAVVVVFPIVAVLIVKSVSPLWWEGFLEHARQTPSFTGFRIPGSSDLLKIIKAIPGLLLVGGVLIAWFLQKRPLNWKLHLGGCHSEAGCARLVLFWSVFAAVIVVLASLFFLTPNTVAIATYLQPAIVGICLPSISKGFPPARSRAAAGAFVVAALLASTRAIGMTTWGVAAAQDCSYSRATNLVRDAVKTASKGRPVVLSAAYLYGLAGETNVQLVHSDWLGPARAHGQVPAADEDIRRLKPAKLALTQFDYYRRYAPVLEALRSRAGEVRIEVRNMARMPVPDANPRLQRVVQHISWAPVIVNLDWRSNDNSGGSLKSGM